MVDRLERVAQISVTLLGAVALVAALVYGKEILAPLALALVAGVVLSPLSDFWEDRGFSPVWGALLGLVVTLILVGALILALQPVIAQMVEQAPKVWSDMQGMVRALRGLLNSLTEVTDSVAEAVAPEAQAEPAAGAGAGEGVAIPSVTDALLVAPFILSQILIFAGVLFFFLLTRGEIYRWVALRLTGPEGRGELARRLRRAERNVSRYFLTITLINAGLGAVTAGALQAMGLQGAMVWGMVAFIANFIVYLGPAVLVAMLFFAGVAQFDGPLALMPAAAFMVANAIEGQFVTPALVGRHMAVNPLLVFLSLVFGIWLWGPIGGIVAIPLLLWVLVLSDATTDPARAEARDIAA